MKAFFLYHPNSEYGRSVEDYVHDFNRRGGVPNIELQSLETKEGAANASLYDIVQYPALLVLSNDGSLQKAWLGDNLPLANEVAGYLVA